MPVAAVKIFLLVERASCPLLLLKFSPTPHSRLPTPDSPLPIHNLKEKCPTSPPSPASPNSKPTPPVILAF
ncbi:MAG: hypothetical protein F6K26_15120 [Moorea sp. SIO2I5]|nr:hypothetical protein [Moorena sp. SIO2I5]